jgi:hypothetical protein
VRLIEQTVLLAWLLFSQTNDKLSGQRSTEAKG